MRKMDTGIFFQKSQIRTEILTLPGMILLWKTLSRNINVIYFFFFAELCHFLFHVNHTIIITHWHASLWSADTQNDADVICVPFVMRLIYVFFSWKVPELQPTHHSSLRHFWPFARTSRIVSRVEMWKVSRICLSTMNMPVLFIVLRHHHSTE